MSDNNEGKIIEAEESLDSINKDITEEYSDDNSTKSEWKYVEENKGKKSNIVKFLVFFIVGIAVLAGAALLGVKGYETLEASKNSKDKVVASGGTSEVDNGAPSAKAPLTMSQVTDLVHKMSNGIIVAADGEIWGKEEITMRKIDDVLASTKDVDNYLYDEISKWKNLDFSNAVDVHNYVWASLQGTIGRAVSLNDEEIEKVKASL